jgi:hypothetical protein
MTDDPFVAHRSLLFTVAYELLGSAADVRTLARRKEEYVGEWLPERC